MSDLIAVAYPDRETAETVRSRLMQLMTERAIELEDAVVVDRDAEGKVKLHQIHRPAAAGATGGALWGGLITPDKVLPQIAQYGGEVIQTSLDNDSEERLREVLERHQATAPAG